MNGKVLFDEREEETDEYDSESIYTVQEYGVDIWGDEGPEIWLASVESYGYGAGTDEASG